MYGKDNFSKLMPGVVTRVANITQWSPCYWTNARNSNGHLVIGPAPGTALPRYSLTGGRIYVHTWYFMITSLSPVSVFFSISPCLWQSLRVSVFLRLSNSVTVLSVSICLSVPPPPPPPPALHEDLVNTDKTKIIVFYKGCHLSSRENWYLGEQTIEIVGKYKDLGFNFSTILSYNTGTEDFVARAKKGTIEILKALRTSFSTCLMPS